MSEWLFNAIGEGGTASPPQYWDMDKQIVRVGDARKVVAPEDPDFELLRPARNSSGQFFPCAFQYSPSDGGALRPPPAPIPVSVCLDGIPKIGRPSGAFLVNMPRVIPVPGDEVAFAGQPSLGLICNLTEGKAYRWSPSRDEWTAIAPLPQASNAPALHRPAATANGFVYAGAEQAIAVVYPGSDAWQRIDLSPEGAAPLTPAIRDGQGATLLCWFRNRLSQLVWSPDNGWRSNMLSGDGTESRDILSIASTPAGVVGTSVGSFFQISSDYRLVRRKWPEGFAPLQGFVAFGVADKVYVFGNNAQGVPVWAIFSHENDQAQCVKASHPATPFGNGFVTDTGWSTSPAPGGGPGLRLPSDCIGRPLTIFDDGVLFLAVEAGGLWPEALAEVRRRWKVRLVLS